MSTYQPCPPIHQHADAFRIPDSISALSFDPLSDTLWAGLSSGRIVSFYSSRGYRGVSFPVGGDAAVRGLIATDSNVRAFAVGGDGVGAWGKGGVNKWYYRLVNTSRMADYPSNILMSNQGSKCNYFVFQQRVERFNLLCLLCGSRTPCHKLSNRSCRPKVPRFVHLHPLG